MANQKITKELIENMIKEELQNEGFFSRISAQAQGNKSALKSLGQRGVQALNLLVKGKADLSQVKDPQVAKAVGMATQRIKSYEQKFAALLLDFTNDLEMLFGEDNLSNVPELKALLGKLDSSSTAFAQELKNIGLQVQGKLNISQDGQSKDGQPKKSTSNIGGKPWAQGQTFESKKVAEGKK